MGTRRAVTCLFVLMLASFAWCKPEFLELFRKHYSPASMSELFKAGCVTCHVSKNNFSRNPYGKALEALVRKTPNQSLTVAMLQQVESEDSNGDGTSNGETIKAGLLPGAGFTKATPGEKPAEEAAPLVPNHSFHPAVVHFPIALFIFGALLDLWGWRKRKPEMRSAALFALWIGSLTSLVALPTGIAAWLRLGYELQGNLLIHLILAVVSSVMMIGIAAWRRRGPLDGAAYWFALLLATVAVGAAGHFGASMVYPS